MAISRSERLINLVICLLSSRQFISPDRIRMTVDGYHESGSEEAFTRMFERDKNELRDLGIPIERGRPIDSAYEDGYRIERGEYEIGDISLDQEEAEIITKAAAMWHSPSVTSHIGSAIKKLKAAGVDVSDAESSYGDDQFTQISFADSELGSEEKISILLSAIGQREAVSFTHRGAHSGEITKRKVEPWGIVTLRGRWYLVSYDLARDDVRTFRISRIFDDVTVLGKAQKPRTLSDIHMREHVKQLFFGSDKHSTATIWLADGAGVGLLRTLRNRGEVYCENTPIEIGGTLGKEYRIENYSLSLLARHIVSLGKYVKVIEPDQLKEDVIEKLHAVALAHQDSFNMMSTQG